MSTTPEDPTEDNGSIAGAVNSDPTPSLSPNTGEPTGRKSTVIKPLLFTGMQQPTTAPLVFQGVSPNFDEINTDDSISDAVWRMIKSGKILNSNFLPSYLLDTDNTEKLGIRKNKDPNSCIIQDNGADKITITRNPDKSLGFVVDSSKKDGINPIRLMITTAKCATELEINLRIERMLGHPPSEKETKEAREKILKANPKLLHFTINTCANATDVALMLIEMKNGAPRLEATLTPEVIATVNQEISTLSPAHQKVIQDQLNKQNPSPPSPKSEKPHA